jgi:hypothetical protein
VRVAISPYFDACGKEVHRRLTLHNCLTSGAEGESETNGAAMGEREEGEEGLMALRIIDEKLKKKALNQASSSSSSTSSIGGDESTLLGAERSFRPIEDLAMQVTSRSALPPSVFNVTSVLV